MKFLNALRANIQGFSGQYGFSDPIPLDGYGAQGEGLIMNNEYVGIWLFFGYRDYSLSARLMAIEDSKFLEDAHRRKDFILPYLDQSQNVQRLVSERTAGKVVLSCFVDVGEDSIAGTIRELFEAATLYLDDVLRGQTTLPRIVPRDVSLSLHTKPPKNSNER